MSDDGEWIDGAILDDWRARDEAKTARIEALEAAIKRQAGASRTLRDHTMAEVQHLKDMDRSEYNAAKSLDSEREANAILTAQVEALTAQLAQRDAQIMALQEAHAEQEEWLHKMDAALKAADELALVMDLPMQSCGKTSLYSYDWHKVDDAIAAYRKARGQDAG